MRYKERRRVWQHIEMLPVLYERVVNEQKIAKEQFDYLESIKESPYVLDDHTVEAILQTYSDTLSESPLLREQCQTWRRECYLSAKHKEMLALLEQMVASLEKLSQKILFLAEHYSLHTIDKIMNKEEGALIQEILMGKAYAPQSLESLVIEAREAVESIPVEQKEVIIAIHEKVLAIRENGGSEVDIIVVMVDELPLVKTLLRHSPSTLNYYFSLYPGFYDYISLIQSLAEALSHSEMEV